MRLSIVTINYNNAKGLECTLNSVLNQSYKDIEHIVIDGASADGSVDVIREYAEGKTSNITHHISHIVKWVSEPDNGIYNAMNKGIRKATGAYIQILNSGDRLAAPDVTDRMMKALTERIGRPESSGRAQSGNSGVDILYGNMVKKDYSTGKILGKSRVVEYSLRQYYSSTMNHDCCYIRRDLFEQYGLYDEGLKIVSDWKWFLQAIGLGKVKPIYVDIDVTIFDASGISETNLALRNQERRQVLEQVLPPAVLADYDKHAFETQQMDRLRKHHVYGLVYFVERVLFKLEKWHVLHR